jgi:signal transduction histidine kinase
VGTTLSAGRSQTTAKLPAEQRQERHLATARLALAVLSLVAIWIDPTEPVRYAELAYGLLAVYTAWSAAVFLGLWRSPRLARMRGTIHGVDIVWAASISLFTDGPNSPFFLFFVFALLAAAYRWEMRETLLTVAAVIGTLAVQAVTLTMHLRVIGEFEMNRLIMRGTYAVILGVLMGALAEAQARERRREAAVVRVLGQLHGQRALNEAIERIGAVLLEIFGARACLAVVRDRYGRAFLWNRQAGSDHMLHPSDPDASDFCLVPAPVALVRNDIGWHAAVGRKPDGYRVPSPIAQDAHAQRLLVVPATLPDEFDGEIYLVDPAGRLGQQLDLLAAIAERIGPAVHNLYLVRRLRTRATAIERSRIARELHDGPLQSLLALDVRLDVLRRLANSGVPEREIAGMQEEVREQARSLREVMQELKPAPVDSQQLADWIGNFAYRFQNETGIETHCVLAVDDVPMPSRVCTEVVRIVQEALVNVRKHSHAAHVVIRFLSDGDRLRLVIDDDGRGFPFQGRMEHEQLFAARKGPILIKERVVAIGGELAIESSGKGARLEISLSPKPVGASA